MNTKIRRLAMLGAFSVLIYIRLLNAKNPVNNNT